MLHIFIWLFPPDERGADFCEDVLPGVKDLTFPSRPRLLPDAAPPR